MSEHFRVINSLYVKNYLFGIMGLYSGWELQNNAQRVLNVFLFWVCNQDEWQLSSISYFQIRTWSLGNSLL